MNQHTSRLLLRWSAAIVTLLTFCGVCLVLSDIYVPVKHHVEICLEHDGKVYGYMAEFQSLVNGDTLTAHCASGVAMDFKVERNEKVQGTSVLELLPCDSAKTYGILRGAPRLDSYVYRGRTRLADLMLTKWRVR